MSGWEFTPTDPADIPSLAEAAPMPITLTDFLLARIKKDEAVARSAADDSDSDDSGHWEYVEYPYEGGSPQPPGRLAGGTSGYDPGLPWTELVNRYDPARVLAECEAKRRIVAEVSYWLSVQPAGVDAPATVEMMTRPLKHLALPYADHPDYREEWRP